MANNKVEFGISNLYVMTYTVATDGTVTLGTPYHQPGAVSFSPEEDSENTKFYADNMVYYSSYAGGSFEGDLTVAKFDDTFKTQFLGYISKSDGGIALTKNATKPNVAIAFQVEGDQEGRRVIMYNCSLGGISREFSTIEDTKTPATEAISVTVAGDNKTGVSMVSYNQSATGYSTLFTSPPVPTTT